MPGTLTDLIEKLVGSAGVEIVGQVEGESDDSMTLQVSGSLYDIPKRQVLLCRDEEVVSRGAGETFRNVVVTIRRDAKILQRSPVTAGEFMSVGADSSACACACACNCACDCACDCACACGGCGCTGRAYLPHRVDLAFRSPVLGQVSIT